MKGNKFGDGVQPDEQAFGARICADGKQLKQRSGPSEPAALTETSFGRNVTPQGEAIKLFLADAALHDKDLLGADCGNAFNEAPRRAGIDKELYLMLTGHLARYGEDGKRLCVKLLTFHYGEQTAGDAWHNKHTGDIQEVGWVPAPECPPLHFFKFPDGSVAAVLLLNTDDALMSLLPKQHRDLGISAR